MERMHVGFSACISVLKHIYSFHNHWYLPRTLGFEDTGRNKARLS